MLEARQFIQRAIPAIRALSLSNWILFSIVIFCSIPESHAASNQALTYQGRIVRPDGNVPDSGTITFTLSIYSPAPSKCLLYSENQSINMTGSGGLFSLSLGAGTRTDGGAHTFSKIFVNGGTLSGLTCASGTSYSPAATDDRSIVVSFNDSGTVVQLSEMNVKSVPFALQAAEIGGYGINDLVKVHPTAGSATTFTAAEMAVAKVITALSCANNEIIKYNGTTWACSADATGGSPSDASYAAKGVVQFDTNAATSGITVAAGVARLSNTGVSANTYGSATKVGTFTVDAQGRITSASDVNIAIPPSQITQGGANNGEVLKWNGSNWVPSSDLGTTTDASYAAKGIVQFNTDAATSGISMAAGVATVNTGTGANQIVKLDGTGKLPAVDGSALTGVTATGYSGVLPIANGGTNSSTALNNDRMMISSAGKIVEAPAMTNGQIMIGSTGAAPTAATLGQSNGISITNGAGTISIATNATSANTASTIVSRDASGNFNAGTGSFSSTQLRGSTSGTLTITVPNTVTDYTIKWPAAVGGAGSFLTTDASGNLSWGSPAAISDSSYTVKGAVQFDTNAATSGITVASGVASVNTGTGANQIVKLDGTGKLPAVDGSALTGLTASQIPDLDAGKITSGVLPIARGGTNNGSLGVTAGGVVYGDGSKLMMSAAGTAGQALLSNGAGVPAFGTLGITGGGTGVTSFTPDRLLGTTVGGALSFVNCSQGQVLSFDASGVYGCYNVSSIFNGFVDGGNTFTATATLGTNSNHNLALETNGSTRMTILNDGKVGIGADSPNSQLEVVSTRTESGAGYSNGTQFSLTANPSANSSRIFSSIYGLVESEATNNFDIERLNGIRAKANHYGGGTVTSLNGGYFEANSAAPGSVTTTRGIYASGYREGAATNIIGGEFFATKDMGGNATNVYGIKSTAQWSGGTITNLFGTKIVADGSTAARTSVSYGAHLQVTGAATGYGLYVDDVDATAAYGIYQVGTTDSNYFAGNVGIGANNPSTPLDLNGAFTQRGMAAPAASPAGQGRIYFDSTSNKFRVSQNGAAYVDLVPSATADASYAAKGVVQFDTNAATSGITVASGVASVNTGTGANQIVKLDGTGKLPAVDGSNLTNLDAGDISTGVLPIARGGTNNGSLGVTAGGMIYADGSKLMTTAAGNSGQALISAGAGAPAFGTLGVGGGGTGITSGTSGGIPYFSAANTMASSGALTANGVVLGGGAGGAPISTGAGAAYSVLRVPSGGGAPAFGAIDLSQSAAVTGTLAVANGGTGVTSFTPDRLFGTNSSGALSFVTCSLGQVLSFDASGVYGCYNVSSIFSGFQDGGNTFTATATLGTNSNHNLQFETFGTTRMTILNDGKVGIGTSSPSGALHVAGTLANYMDRAGNPSHLLLRGANGTVGGETATVNNDTLGRISMVGHNGTGYVATSQTGMRAQATQNWNATNNGSALYFSTTPNNTTTAQDRMMIDQNGNVGIGTTSPAYALSIYRPSSSSIVYNNSGTNDAGFWASGYRGVLALQSSAGGADAKIKTIMSDSGSLKFGKANDAYSVETTHMTILDDGKVGIGTTTPDDMLDVRYMSGAWNLVSYMGGQEMALLSAYNPSSSGERRLAFYKYRGTWGTPLVVQNEDSLSSIYSNGYDGSASVISTGIESYVDGVPSAGHVPGRFEFHTDNGTTSAARMVIKADGKVGIGETSPRSALDVKGAISGNPAISVAAGTVNFASHNLAYTAQNCGAFALWNMKDGSSYTFAVQGTTSSLCSFTAFSGSGSGALTVKMPPDHTNTTTGKDTVYTFLVLGSTVYVSWIPGY